MPNIICQAGRRAPRSAATDIAQGCTTTSWGSPGCPGAGWASQHVPNHTNGSNWKAERVGESHICNLCSFSKEPGLFLILLASPASPMVHFFLQPQSVKSICKWGWRTHSQCFQTCMSTECKVTFWSKILEICRLSVLPWGPAHSLYGWKLITRSPFLLSCTKVLYSGPAGTEDCHQIPHSA